MNKNYPTTGHTERLVRSLLLLLCSAVFSLIAWAAGAYQIKNQTLLFGMIGGIIIAAILVSRFGAKWVARRLANRSTPG
jgi:membrane associated rhomboid family serine protease